MTFFMSCLAFSFEILHICTEKGHVCLRKKYHLCTQNQKIGTYNEDKIDDHAAFSISVAEQL